LAESLFGDWLAADKRHDWRGRDRRAAPCLACRGLGGVDRCPHGRGSV